MTKLRFSIAFLLAAFLLAGCGGSSSTAVAPPPPPMDSDDDGVPDADDAFPMDPNETADSDGDGVGDNADAFPMDANETADSDGNGVGDNAQEAMALDDAKAAAMDAWGAARDALASIAGDGTENPVAYQRAMNALADAATANTAAQAATTSAAAQAQQMAAEMARDTAVEQVAMVVYSRDMDAIGNARTAAAQSARAAKTAYEEAKKALEAVEDFKDLNMASYDEAMAQVTAAKMAYDAAMAASNAAAQAMLLGDAQAQQMAAATAKENADTANTNAMKYAGMVQDAEDAGLADARMTADEAYQAAKQAATDARQAANDASDEADAAEAANDGSPAAMDSRTAADDAADAATDAETARDEAGTAKMAADAALTSVEARGHQADAEGKRDEARGHLGTAQMKLAAAEASKIIAQNTGAGTIALWQQRAMDANADAQGYAKDARAAANKADAQADAAEADAAKAMRARTDYDNANKKAVAARNAADAAERAAVAAETAAANAKNALDMATADDATVAVAREQSNIARTEAMGASGKPAEANAEYMKAMEAADEAEMYADRHVISLLSHANGQDITDVTEDVTTAPALMKAREERKMAVRGVIGQAGGNTNNISGDTADTANLTTATASWAADTPDDPDTPGENEFMAGAFSIDVAPGGATALGFNTEADPTATPAVVKTATELSRGLGDFMHGYQIEGTDDNSTQVIVFTDITQTVAAKPQVTLDDAVIISNRPVTASQVVIQAGATTLTGALYDHDGDADTNGLTATYACGVAPATACSFEIEDGKVTSLVGYVVSVTIDDTAANSFVLKEAVTARPDTDYLVLGVWLQEDSNGTADGTPKAFAAFADGPATSTTPVELTGTAKYIGKATGVYTEGDGVDYFEGDATLTANFGAPGTADDPAATDDEAGTITGMINNIYAGGNRMSDVISLNDDGSPDDGNIAAAGTFNGDVRMGPVKELVDNVATYHYNGSWSGQFYGPATDIEGTTLVEAPANTAPGSAAGTFGVTGTMGEGDDAVTRSYVGAFGAHKDD